MIFIVFRHISAISRKGLKMKGFEWFLLFCLFVLVSVVVGLHVRNWSRRRRFFSEFRVEANSDFEVVKRAIFLRLQDRRKALAQTEDQLSTLRRGIDQLAIPSDLMERQKEIDKLQKLYWHFSAQIKRARNMAYLCLPAGGHDPKFLFESVDWSLEHNNSPLTS